MPLPSLNEEVVAALSVSSEASELVPADAQNHCLIAIFGVPPTVQLDKPAELDGVMVTAEFWSVRVMVPALAIPANTPSAMPIAKTEMPVMRSTHDATFEPSGGSSRQPTA